MINLDSSSATIAADYLLEIIAIMLIAGMIFAKLSRVLKIPDVVLFI